MKMIFAIGSLCMGGAQRVAVHLVHEWLRQGWDVTLIVTNSGQNDSFYKLPGNVKVVFLSDCSGGHRWRLLDRIGRLVALRKTISEVKPDIIVSFIADANITTLIASIGIDCGKIISERVYPPRNEIGVLFDALRDYSYQLADLVVFQTNKGTSWWKGRTERVRGCTIPNPVVWPLAKTSPIVDPDALIRPEAKLLLAVGRLVHQKGFDVLLEAFAIIRSDFPNWTLAVLGTGEQKTLLQGLVKKYKMSEAVVLPGPAGNIRDWYQRADLFALSSRFEGFPNTLIEAMAHGCAAISFDCDTGPRDIITHEYDGILIENVGDIAALSEALRRLMSDQQLRCFLAERAINVRQRYSIDAVMKLWDAEIARTMNE